MPRPPAPDDDAALRWDEFDDPSYVESDAAIAARTAEEADAVGADDASGASVETSAGDAAERPATGLRLLTAVFALVYLALTVGWIIGIGLVPLSGPTVAIEIMYQFSEFLAIIAAPLWFAAVVSLTREGQRAAHRFGWLALGTLVLLPWPIVLGVLA